MKKIIVISFAILSILACDDHLSGYKDSYRRALANLDISCKEGNSEIYLKCDLDDEPLCYYEGVDNYEILYGYATRSVTPGPSFTTGDTIQVQGRFGKIRFYDPENANDDILDIWFPLGPFEQSETRYLDRLFSEKELNYNASGDSNNVVVKYLMKEPAKYSGFNVYDNSSEHGVQEENAYFRIEQVEKEEDDATITYRFEFKFKCSLYYNPQYKSDVGRELDNGVFKGEITIDK
ncbi:MAG: hypothetical protein AAGA77_07205 [Bacteroidota bacterium]